MSKHETSLEESKELNRRLIEAVPGGVVHIAADGSIRSANTAACAFLGLTYDELTSKYASDFDKETIFEDGSICRLEDYPASKAMATGEPQLPITIGVRTRSGDIAWAIFTAVPVMSGEDVTGAVITFVDISERKRIEDERRELEHQLRHAQKMESVGQLAGGIAHDFNNLLQAILCNVDLALDANLAAARHRDCLLQARRAADRASELAQQLLAFGKRQHLKRAPIALNELIAPLARMLRRLIGEGIDLEFIPGQDLGLVNADGGHIEQVIVNLIVNARDAMQEGGRITITTENVPGEGGGLGHVRIRVHDAGHGMTPDVASRAFEPFFTTKETGKGTGLGLSVVYGIAQQHGGTVRLDTVPGKGSTFDVLLPRTDLRPPPASEERPSSPEGGTETILVVDDEELVRSVAVNVLEHAGYRVLAAANGGEALEIYRQRYEEVSLVLMDVVMPRMNGRRVHELMQEIHPDVPTIFTSGYDASSLEREADVRVEVLEKPYGAETLLQRVRDALGVRGTAPRSTP